MRYIKSASQLRLHANALITFPLLGVYCERLPTTQLAAHEEAITAKGAAFRVLGFVDGSHLQICRPQDETLQAAHYNGYYATHVARFQFVTTPDGLVAHLSKIGGRENDPALYAASCVSNCLRRLDERDNKTYCIYGDKAYVGQPGLLAAPRCNMSQSDAPRHATMTKARTSVEHMFGIVPKVQALNACF